MEAACQKNDTPGKRGEQLAQDRAGWTEAEEVTLSKASGIPRGRHCNDVKEFRGLLYTQCYKAFHKVLHQTAAAKEKSFGRRSKAGAYTVNRVKSRSQTVPEVKILQGGMKSTVRHSRGQFKSLNKALVT